MSLLLVLTLFKILIFGSSWSSFDLSRFLKKHLFIWMTDFFGASLNLAPKQVLHSLPKSWP